MDPSVQQAIAMALIGLAGTAFGLLSSTIRDRDKLRYDARMQSLEAGAVTRDMQIEALTTQNTGQAKQIAGLMSTVSECETRHEDRDRRERETQTRIDDLVNAVIRMGGGSGLHSPIAPK